jgi:hypothetical protein
MRKAFLLLACLALFLFGAMGVWFAGKRGTPDFLRTPAPAYESLLRASARLGDNSPNPNTNRLASYVESNAEALKTLRAALTQRFEAPAAAYDQRTLDRVLSEFPVKALALTLRTEGRAAELNGKIVDAARSYVDIIHLGTKVASGPVIFSMIGLGIERLGIEALQELEPRLPSPARNEIAAKLRTINDDRINFTVVEERERHFRQQNSPSPLHFMFFSRQLRQGVESARHKHELSGQAVDALASKLDLPPKN